MTIFQESFDKSKQYPNEFVNFIKVSITTTDYLIKLDVENPSSPHGSYDIISKCTIMNNEETMTFP